MYLICVTMGHIGDILYGWILCILLSFSSINEMKQVIFAYCLSYVKKKVCLSMLSFFKICFSFWQFIET